jgi:transcriptional regulator with XRE-family HTH domain
MRKPTNPLRRYIKEGHATRKQIADAAGLDFSYLCRLVSGSRRPGIDTAAAIERATGGAVPVAAWASRAA